MKGKRKLAMFMTICMIMTLMTGLFSVGNVTVSAVYPDPLGKYITPLGAGLKDGTSWENAYDFRVKTFSTAWSAVPANGTLYVGSGTYNGASVSATSSGQSSTAPKKLLGVDTGAGKPIVHGSFVATNTSGPTFFNISSGVNNINVENIRVENYYIAVKTNGNQSYITIKNIDTYVSCYSLYLNGGGTNTNTLKLSFVTVDSCNFYYYTKTGIRMQNRTEDALISNCLADAGGIDYFINDPAIYWPVGFCQLADSDTPNMFEDRITYVDCTAKNSYVDLGPTEYWNGDGFTTERNANNISYIRCKAYGNTDGGWDCKAATISLTDCIGMDNKRNIRLWGTATLTNCLAAYSYKRGGGYSSSGLWCGGPITANYCTFYNNQSSEVETDTGVGGSVTLNDCIVGTNLFGQTLYTGGNITKNRTLDYNIESCIVDPRIKAYDNSLFYATDDRYNSIYGNTKGYYCDTTNVYPTPTPAPITPTPIPSPGVTNLLCDNFDRYIDVADVQTGGWSMVTPTPTTVASPILAATAAPANFKSLKSVPSTNVSKTFAPIALTAAGGASPGKNAKLVVAFDAYTSGGTGADQAYWKVQDSATGYNAVSAGRRGSNLSVRYSKSIPSTFTGLTISTGLSRFTKLKFVIKITDSTGAFLTGGPKVDVYCGDMATPIASGADVNMIDAATTKVDRFYMGGALSMEVDNLEIYKQADVEQRVIWQEDFSDTVKYPNVYSAYAAQALTELQNAGWVATNAPCPYVSDATKRYLRVTQGTGGTTASVSFNLPETFRVSNGTLSGTDPGHPGNNAKLILEYNMLVSPRNNQYASATIALNSLQGQQLAGIKIYGASPYTKAYIPANPNVTPYIPTSTWTKYKHVLKLTDSSGNYVGTTDLYVDRGDGNGYVLESGDIPYNTSAVTVGSFSIGTKDTYSANGWSVDDIKVTLSY